jgi:hypothetical protein
MGRPSAAFRIRAVLSGDAPGAVPPSFTGTGEAAHFSRLVIPLALVMAQATSSLTAAPMNSNFRASNSIPGCPRTCPSISAPLNLPTVRPSGLATLKTWLAAMRLPAPVMFSTTNVGLPGTCRPMWRAITRA